MTCSNADRTDLTSFVANVISLALQISLLKMNTQSGWQGQIKK